MTHPVSLKVIAESDMSDDMDRAIRELLCACFQDDAEAFSRSRAWHESAPEFTVIAQEGIELVGHIAMVVRPICCETAQISIAGVQSLCVVTKRRRTGLSQMLMREALEEAKRRHVGFGLLFCIPELENLYHALGWGKSDDRVTMLDEKSQVVPIPDKNIGMQIELAAEPFPAGPIFLNGRDW